jgi:hypothetical protein
MKSALKTLLFVAVMGVPTIAIGLLSPGPFARRVLEGGIVLLVLGGAAAANEARRGRKADRESDERAEYILGKSTRFTFFTMAVAIQVYWSYYFSLTGNAGDTSFVLVEVFWFSFVAALAYNYVRG